MRPIDKRLVLKIVLLTSIFWICVQFFLLNFLIIPSGDATKKGNKEGLQKQEQQSGLFGGLSGGGAAALLARLGGGGGSPSLLGEGGKPVRLPANLIADSKAKFGLNQFDVVVSNLISVNRSLPDVRHPSCRGNEQVKMAEESGLNTSVIIVFHNEAWSTLLRTIHSVLNRSPPKLLQEVILVDDASDRDSPQKQEALNGKGFEYDKRGNVIGVTVTLIYPRLIDQGVASGCSGLEKLADIHEVFRPPSCSRDYLGASLETYVAALGAQVRLLRLHKRSGLIRARLAGAREARGGTLTFLDAHCEVTAGWLEPLIVHVFNNPHSVVCPAIDVISDTTFEYLQSTEKTWGVFSWDLLFDWDVVSPREELRRHHNPAMPIRTPAMAGGLFLIRRDYFYSLGAYDEGMEVWGGENVEMSLRVWQCGGELLIIPCSRVGHVFRKVSPYSWPGGVTHVLHRNRVRTARVWLDEFIELPFTLDPSLRTFEFGNVSERIALRRRLKCKSFSWYLQNIFPESNIRPHIARLGQIRNPLHELCFDTGGGRKGQVIAAAACRGTGGGSGNSAQQTFSVSIAGELTASVGCLGAQHIHDSLILGQCDGDAGAFQKFIYDEQAKHIVHVYSNLCVRVDTTRRELPLFLDNCVTSDEFIWELPPPFHNQTLQTQ